jgi:hypothetical protein
VLGNPVVGTAGIGTVGPTANFGRIVCAFVKETPLVHGSSKKPRMEIEGDMGLLLHRYQDQTQNPVSP